MVMVLPMVGVVVVLSVVGVVFPVVNVVVVLPVVGLVVVLPVFGVVVVLVYIWTAVVAVVIVLFILKNASFIDRFVQELKHGQISLKFANKHDMMNNIVSLCFMV